MDAIQDHLRQCPLLQKPNDDKGHKEVQVDRTFYQATVHHQMAKLEHSINAL